LAESNRLPFDLSECEQELVGGFHTEYSGMKFAMFFLGEYTHVVTVCFLVSILFLGGWHFPWIATAESQYSFAWLVKVFVLLTKVFLLIALIMAIRWTIPRFRFDQLMGVAWKVLIPLSMANILATMIVRQYSMNFWWLLPISIVLFAAAGLISLYPQRQPQQRASAPQVESHG
jgi:NADH-quinone oxidoreductase subunit H